VFFIYSIPEDDGRGKNRFATKQFFGRSSVAIKEKGKTSFFSAFGRKKKKEEGGTGVGH